MKAHAQRLGLDRTSLTYLLDGLEKQTLIKRTTDPDDRRNRHINLTAKGSETLGQLARAVEQVELSVLSRLPQAEARQLYASIVKAAGLVEGAPAPANADEVCREALADI